MMRPIAFFALFNAFTDEKFHLWNIEVAAFR